VASPTTITVGGTAGLTGTFTNGSGIITPGNLVATSGTAVPVTPLATTTYMLTVTNSAGTTATQTVTLTVVQPPTTPVITAPTNVTAGQGYTASIVAQSGSTYAWAITGGTISGSNTSTSLSFTAGASGTVQLSCVVTNAAGTASAPGSASCTIVPNGTPVISAPSYVTAGSTGLTASVPAQAGSAYAWTIVGGTITGGGTTNQITFNPGASGSVQLGCIVTNSGGTASPQGTATCNIVAAPTPPVITAPAYVTSNATGLTASVPTQAGCTYAWTATGGTITAGGTTNQITFTSGAFGTVALGCVVTNAAGAASSQGTATCSIVAAPITPVITAPAYVTSNATGLTASVPTQAGCTYAWSITGGTITIGGTTNQISFTAGASGSVQLSCVVTNAAGTASSQGTATCIIIAAPITPIITAPNSVTAGQGPYYASVPTQNNSTYSWSITGGMITAGGTTIQITFTAGATGSVQLSCVVTNAVGAASSQGTATCNIVAAPAVPVISAPASVTASATGLTASVPTQAGCTYAWTITGGSITAGGTSNQITFTAGASGTIQLGCVVTNPAGTHSSQGTANCTIVVAPSISSFKATNYMISGGTGTYLTANFTGGTGWISPLFNGSVSSGTPISTDILTTTTTYTLTVTNSIGATATAQVTINVISVTINNFVTTGFSGLIASTQNWGTGTTYNWTMVGGTITSGQGTSSITFTSGAVGTLTASVTVTSVPFSAVVSGQGSATVLPQPNAELFLPTSVHPGDTWMRASVPIPGPSTTNIWAVLSGTSTGSIVSGQGSGTIGFSSGSVGVFQIQANVQQSQTGTNVTAARTVSVQTGTWLIENGGSSVPRTGATATLLPSGRVLVAGGANQSAELYDPSTGTWILTGSMNLARTNHTATLLPDGTVLVAGGNSSYIAEIYNPATGTWTPTGSMKNTRSFHTATLMQDGTVMVAGGYDGISSASSEIYNPATGTWNLTPGNMTTGRVFHTATLLQNGMVLVTGGQNRQGTLLNTSELYNPATLTWTPTGILNAYRFNHTATLLQDGTVLLVGGDDSVSDLHSLSTSEIYNPTTRVWATTTGGLSASRESHTATLLQDGTVLVSGGRNLQVGVNGTVLSSSEIYNPTTGTWQLTWGNLNNARASHTATLLQDGTVLVAGGGVASSEIYQRTSKNWSLSISTLGTARFSHTATLLPNGTVLVAGGWDGGDASSTEIFDPVTRNWTTSGSLTMGRYSHTASLLSNGTLLVVGGTGAGGILPIPNAEVFNPSTGIWTPTGSLHTGRMDHTATLLANGKVLVAGGTDANGYGLTSAEIYDPTTRIWTATGSLGSWRSSHTATLLQNGYVLVAGGDGLGTSAEIYNPSTGTWTPTGNLNTGRNYHTATLLPGGKVLVAGGSGASGYLATSETYNPANGTWTLTGSLNSARDTHTATLLPSGKVLVVGGTGATADIATSEIYNPASGTWAVTGSLNAVRDSHTATLLNNGTVLVGFGLGADVVTEIYMP
jgi:N-acetylneuraminic acid mutarotase